jgi:DNA repair exonuclease SbcCD ATPase subunit
MDDEIKKTVALAGKIAQLVSLHENEKRNALILMDKITSLEKQIESLETDKEMLEKINCQLKLATAFNSKGDTSDAKSFIDELVREIDEIRETLLNR